MKVLVQVPCGGTGRASGQTLSVFTKSIAPRKRWAVPVEKRDIKALLQNVVIATPCTVGWDSMSGDDKVRLCSECNLNVHNLSSMSDQEAALVLQRRKIERTCVFMYRRKDGSVVTDNCPARFRKVRNYLGDLAASTLLTLASGIWLSAKAAGGIAGAVVDPAFGQGNGVHSFADFGYDDARKVANILTAIAAVIVFLIPLDRNKKLSTRRLILRQLALASIPVLIDLAGTFMLNNFGGLGGGF